MTPKSAFIKWSLIGTVVAGILVAGQIAELGGAAGMLQVGQTSSLRPMIEEQLGDIPLTEFGGHDGQIFYAMGLDLDGNQVSEVLDDGAFRYRRILYPFLASFGGLLDGYPLLYGMIAIAVLSMGLAAGSIASIAARFDRSDWLALVVVLNPGMWLSIRLLTSDALAMAMMALGLLAVVSGWRVTAGLFAASTLSKDIYLITPAGLMADRRTRRWSWAVIPALAVAVWATVLTITMGDGFTGRGNLDWPFAGFVTAYSNWGALDGGELFYLGFALVSVAVGLGHGLLRRSWLRWPILGWSLLAVISSNWVWDFGNNAARAFAPIVVLVAAAEAADGISIQPPTTSRRNLPV